METIPILQESPWLSKSLQKNGRKLVDVSIKEVPKNLIVIPFFSDLPNEILLLFHQYDRNEYHTGWEESFSLTLEFPSGSTSQYYEVEVPPSFHIPDYHTVKVSVSSDTILRERPVIPRKIPYIVWNISAPPEKQASPLVRRNVQVVRDITSLLQASSLHFVLDDEACREEVQNSGMDGFLEAYDSLRAGSYKADLVRYWLLYKFGGIYHDDKTLIREPLDNDELFLQADLFVGVHRTPEIAFMGARRGSPIMFEVLKKAIYNIRMRRYTEHRLGITGNFVFTSVMESQNDPGDFREGIWRKYWGENVALLPITIANNKIIVNKKVIWEKSLVPNCDWPKGKSHYTNLWAQRQVFIDGNPPLTLLQTIRSWKHLGSMVITISLFLSLLIIGFMIKYNEPISVSSSTERRRAAFPLAVTRRISRMVKV